MKFLFGVIFLSVVAGIAIVAAVLWAKTEYPGLEDVDGRD